MVPTLITSHNSTALQKKTIVIDARMVNDYSHGISLYVQMIFKGLKELHENKKLFYEPIFLIHKNSKLIFHPFVTLQAKTPFLGLAEVLEIPTLLRGIEANAYHSTSFSSLWNCPCPSLITVHDLNHLKFGGVSKWIYYQTLLRNFIKKSETILTVSEYSRKEISDWLGIPKNQILLIYNAINMPQANHWNLKEAESTLERYQVERNKYFLSFSNFKIHKNAHLLIQAYRTFKDKEVHGWPLLITASKSKSKLDHLIPNAEDIRLIGGIPDQDAQILLAFSGGLLSPSLYEGFGLPPVEAASIGVPIAVSNIPPHQEGLIDLNPEEVAWIRPDDLDGWVKAFFKLFRSEIAKTSPETQRKIKARFNSSHLAQEIDQAYRHVLNCSE